MNQSESINELAKALSQTQGKMTAAKKDTANPFFKSKYADLSSVWEACRAPMAEHGLAVIQTTNPTDGRSVELVTTLMHSSGQWMSGTLTMIPSKQDPQGMGSCLTYMRRYALSAILGVSQDDDDANTAAGKDVKSPTQNPAAQPQRPLQNFAPKPTSPIKDSRL